MFSTFKLKRATPKKSEQVTGILSSTHLTSPFVKGQQEWDARYGSYVARARTWQLVALAALALAALLAAGLVNIASQSRVQPFIVEVDKLGQAVAVKPADVGAIPDERILRFQLASFVTNARSVTPDPMVQKKWLDSVYALASQPTAAYLNDFYRKADPFVKGRTSMVGVEIQSAQPLSKNTWQVQWTETTRNLGGQVERITRWQAIVNVTNFAPSTPQQIIANPTGVVVDQLNWTQLL